jgi:hydroxymethylglutaryl-CoA reductase (NADPH)
MTTTSKKAKKLLNFYSGLKPLNEIMEELKPETGILDDVLLPKPTSWDAQSVEKRRSFIEERTGNKLNYLRKDNEFPSPDNYRGNIENYIGMTCVPTGIIGPLHIKGTEAKGDFYVPLATSEGALIASYHRGAKATRLSGGISCVCLTEGVQRTPLFRFNNLSEVGSFLRWILDNIDIFKKIVHENSKHAILEDVRINIEGNQVLLIFEYTTGDASGQNMVTFCTEAVCKFIIHHTPIKPKYWFIESNYSGDKKATAVSFTNVRGKKVTAEVVVKRDVAKKILFAEPQEIWQYWESSSVAAVQSVSIGMQGHFANGLTAIFMACGQDVACISEAYVGITRMEVTENNDLYVTVTLPSLMVGTVGGGTELPTQKECLQLIGCRGKGKARKFAEICAATVLAGELSIAAAIASGNFSKAHKIFGRKKK